VIRISKVKFEGTGEKGNVRLRFDRPSARFEMLASYELGDEEPTTPQRQVW
jgi:hypothetical protein